MLKICKQGEYSFTFDSVNNHNQLVSPYAFPEVYDVIKKTFYKLFPTRSV